MIKKYIVCFGLLALFACKEDSASNGIDGKNGSPGFKGDPGEIGPRGPRGLRGEPGESASNQIFHSVSCEGVITSPNGNVGFNYNVAEFESGDVFSSASVYSPATQVSRSGFFTASQDEKYLAAQVMVYDIAPPANYGNWTVSLNRNDLTMIVRYTDLDVSNGNYSWTLPDLCIEN